MASKRKVSLMRHRPLGPNYQGGLVLRPSAGLQARYIGEWEKLVREMHEEIVSTLTPYARGSEAAMDAVDGKFWQGLAMLRRRLEDKFAGVAEQMAARMTAAVDKSADSNLKRSLKELSEGFTVQMNNPPALQALIDARIRENVYLIKKIPEQYLDRLTESVNKSIMSGQGLKDLQPAMEERYGESVRWARNVALDQTNKAYRDVNAERMRQAGLRKFEWIHTSAAKEPRHYHMLSAAAGGLNGGVFDLDNPPIINQATGQRGLPGDDYFCHCTMRPVIEV